MEEIEIESRRLVFSFNLRYMDAPSSRVEDIESSRSLSLIWRGARSIWKDGFDAFLLQIFPYPVDEFLYFLRP